MSAARTAVFRADATPQIGGGHVVRCLTLADALAERGWRCGFAVKHGTLETFPALGRSCHDILELDCAASEEPASLAARWPDGADWLIADHYGRNATFENACRPWARRIMAIDDLADRAHDCDLLLDQTLGRQAADYAPHTPESCQLLLGPHYALLRPAFAAARERALARRREGGPVRRILVSLGASDPYDVTSTVLGGVAQCELELEVDVVLGAASPNQKAVRNRIEDMSQAAGLHIDSPDMAQLMVDADLAIGAAGSSSWERCCLGLPALLTILGRDQIGIASSLAAARAAIVLGPHERLTPEDVGRALTSLATDKTALRDLAEHALKICDGHGAQRTAVALVQ